MPGEYGNIAVLANTEFWSCEPQKRECLELYVALSVMFNYKFNFDITRIRASAVFDIITILHHNHKAQAGSPW